MRNASGSRSTKSAALRTSKQALVMASTMRVLRTSWNASVPISARGTWPARHTSGTESALASAIAVTRLVRPGPEVARHTPALPVMRASPCAMNPAPCSCRASTWFRLESASAR
jgi:hypothetical protein